MTTNNDILPSEVTDVMNNLDKSFADRRKQRRRAKTYTKQKKEGVDTQNNVTELYKQSLDEKQRERFKKMGYVRRVKYLIEDIDELRKDAFENRKLIRELQSKVGIVPKEEENTIEKIKFNSQLLQRELLQFLTYGKKEGNLIIEQKQFIRIEE